MLRKLALGALSTALLLVAAAPASAVAAKPADPDRGRVLQQALDAVHEAGMPGAFAEVRGTPRGWRGATGLADLETGRPPQPGYRHRVGSITKTFVATTLLQLVAEGKVKLDAPVSRYLADVVPGPLGDQVTVRMLLNHTSGIGNYTDTVFATVDGVIEAQTRTYSARELVAIGLAMPVTNPPGGPWSYSNTNYVILGLLIEKITGRPYAAEISRRILRPLGLRGTYFPGTDPRVRGPHAKAYVPWLDGELRDFSVYNMSWGGAAGELISTPHDLNTFFRALLSGRLLRPAQLAQMQTTVPIDPANPDVGGYGLGLLYVHASCGPMWGHTGGVIGHLTASFHSPDGRQQATIAENMAFYAAGPHPIDEARGRFLDEALCGGQVGTLGAKPASTWELWRADGNLVPHLR